VRNAEYGLGAEEDMRGAWGILFKEIVTYEREQLAGYSDYNGLSCDNIDCGDTGKLRDDVCRTILLPILENLQEISTKILETSQHRFTSRNNKRDGLVAKKVDVCFGAERVVQMSV
jgi:tRNA(Ile)-lysidine synthase TilS/MesJ